MDILMDVVIEVVNYFLGVIRTVISLIKHKQINALVRKTFHFIINLIEMKFFRVAALLLLAAVFSNMDNTALLIGCCVVLFIDNIDLVRIIIGHVNNKRRYH